MQFYKFSYHDYNSCGFKGTIANKTVQINANDIELY